MRAVAVAGSTTISVRRRVVTSTVPCKASTRPCPVAWTASRRPVSAAYRAAAATSSAHVAPTTAAGEGVMERLNAATSSTKPGEPGSSTGPPIWGAREARGDERVAMRRTPEGTSTGIGGDEDELAEVTRIRNEWIDGDRLGPSPEATRAPTSGRGAAADCSPRPAAPVSRTQGSDAALPAARGRVNPDHPVVAGPRAPAGLVDGAQPQQPVGGERGGGEPPVGVDEQGLRGAGERAVVGGAQHEQRRGTGLRDGDDARLGHATRYPGPVRPRPDRRAEWAGHRHVQHVSTGGAVGHPRHARPGVRADAARRPQPGAEHRRRRVRVASRRPAEGVDPQQLSGERAGYGWGAGVAGGR